MNYIHVTELSSWGDEEKWELIAEIFNKDSIIVEPVAKWLGDSWPKQEIDMENAIHVGNKISKETSENLNEIIKTIFTVGYETHMDQTTIVEAIQMIGRVTEIKQVTITNSSFTGDKVVNVNNGNDGNLEE